MLISSVNPLKIWFYDSAYLRFSVEPYDDTDITNQYIHLTNNSISKKSTGFAQNEVDGCMMNIEGFQRFLTSSFGQDKWKSKIQQDIKNIVLIVIKAVGSKITHRAGSFELLGFDFLIDDELTPWLLEVNTSPALDYSTVNF